MTGEFDLAPSLARGVADRAGAWQFIRGSPRAPGRLRAFLNPDDTHIELLEEHAVRLPLPPCPVGREEDGGGMSLYARERSAAGLERVG
ncbi:hypothetical protein ACIQ9E_25430 [Streptomyces sp. NPDC094448]|uniref:hypothetical protein n=1 Tax=Streptomyces sp. NPDC094448 TaxID=3366063 RepID=UPI003823E660